MLFRIALKKIFLLKKYVRLPLKDKEPIFTYNKEPKQM